MRIRAKTLETITLGSLTALGLALAASSCSGPIEKDSPLSVDQAAARRRNTGGRAATGGAAATGGSKSTGGMPATGGTPATGGVSPTGGTIATGGVESTGGEPATGGVESTGGAPATGGVESTGGALATGGVESTGGALATGGVESTGGAPATGGVESTGGAPASGGSSTGPSPASFGFFVMSDVHVTGSTNPVQTAISQMRLIDSSPIGAFATGDLTTDATSAEWTYHDQFISSMFSPSATSFGSAPRYLAALGNHDVLTSNWYSLWSSHMTGQSGLGQSSSSGVYFTTTYQTALFAFMDSEHVSGANTAYADAQTQALAGALQNTSAKLKFLFFHEPAYSCNTTHAGFPGALPWIDLAERNNAVVFAGHTHVYTRRCAMKALTCTSDGSGMVHVELGTVGGTVRPVNVTNSTVKGTDSLGVARTDAYNCTSGLLASNGSNHYFTYVLVNDCTATVSTYIVSAGNTTPFDTWTINRCN